MFCHEKLIMRTFFTHVAITDQNWVYFFTPSALMIAHSATQFYIKIQKYVTASQESLLLIFELLKENFLRVHPQALTFQTHGFVIYSILPFFYQISIVRKSCSPFQYYSIRFFDVRITMMNVVFVNRVQIVTDMNEQNRLEILRAMGHDLQFSIQKLQMLPNKKCIA